MSGATQQRSQRLRTDSVVPPIGGQVDLHGLPLTALVARLSFEIGRELAQVYAEQEIRAQPADASLLILLAKGGARLTALAARLSTSKQALTFVIDRLVRDGYVFRVTDPIDKRAKRIELTSAGETAAAVSDIALRGIERRWRSRAGAPWPELRAALADIASG